MKNALNTALLARLAEVLGGLARDPSCRAVLLTGAAGNFAAGADIGEIESKVLRRGCGGPPESALGGDPGLSEAD